MRDRTIVIGFLWVLTVASVIVFISSIAGVILLIVILMVTVIMVALQPRRERELSPPKDKEET